MFKIYSCKANNQPITSVSFNSAKTRKIVGVANVAVVLLKWSFIAGDMEEDMFMIIE